MRINPYLNFTGRCQEAFAFYATTLGGTVVFTMTHGESPMAAKTPAEWHDKILHTTLHVGDQVLMGSDVPPSFAEAVSGFAVSLIVDDPAEAERVFQALAEGGTVRMPIQETFWARRFGMAADRFGIPWMVNCERPAAEAGA